MKHEAKKQAELLFWLTLAVPPTALFLFGPAAYALISLFFLLTVYFLRFESAKSLRQELSMLLRFRVKQWLSRVLEGNTSQSLYTVVFILAVTVALFAWFADGVKEGNPYLVFGSLAYVVALIFAQDLLLIRFLEVVKPTRRHYVAWASQPLLYNVGPEDYPELIERYKDPNEVRRALSENKLYLEDKEIDTPNILPLIAPLARDDFPAEKFDLLIAGDTEYRLNRKTGKKEYISQAEKYWELVETMARALKPGLEFKLLRRKVPAWDVEGLVKDLNKCYNRKLQERSEDMVFNATSGTAAASAATVLVALRGAAEALYIRQDEEDRPLDERVVFIHLHPLKLPELFSDDLPADVQSIAQGPAGQSNHP